jgi:hypothetical protein
MPQVKSRTSAKGTSAKGGQRSKGPRSGSGGSPNGAANGSASGVAKAVRRAKTPLIAGGAALAGAAGGLALGSRHIRGGKVLGIGASHGPRLQVRSRDLAEAAKNVGQFGAQMGELAGELRMAREQAGGEKRRSPIEVVLEGLTARSSRR